MTPDEEVVARQIGRPPRGMVRVEARCRWGFPTVVAVDPVVPRRGGRGGVEPFPTRFWLTCPILVEQISRLEAGGLVGALEKEMEADPALFARVREDHARHAVERDAALDGPAREAARKDGAEEVLRSSGIGGVRDLRHIKCLHAHYAFHLARRGAVGAILDARHAPRECREDEIRCTLSGVKAHSGTPDESPPGP